MTTPILPDFILKLFQNEINTVVHSEIAKICKLYDLDLDEVTEKLGHVKLDVTATPGFRIRKNNNQNIPPKELRCCARMVHDLEVKQCSRNKYGKLTMCRGHDKMKRENKLKYGSIHDPLPDELNDLDIITTNTKKEFSIIKKKERINLPPKELRCCARMLHDLEVKQCTKNKFEDLNMCQKHEKMKMKNKLKYGSIHDPLPDEFRPGVLAEMKKNKIY
jgi:hypothetical protein